MTANIEDIRILLKLSPQAETVMDTLTEGMSVSDHRKIDNTEGTFMALHVECIGECNLGHIFSLAHYYEQHGDLMRDPEMLFIKAEDGGYYPVEIWQDAVNSHSVGVLIEDGKAVSIDETEQADMTMFAEVWLKNIWEQQGLGEAL
ncbi:hypothetical protein C5S29_13690 [ANME-1 cluster archaeon GoMg3.2]|nr:hypothetical protein [ANME-1 cluster archaeon GoMg3.2]